MKEIVPHGYKVYAHTKNQDFPNFSLDILQRLCKIIWVLCACLAKPIKKNAENLMFIGTKNQLHSSLFSWDIAKTLQTCYFGYFEHDWPWPQKLIASTWQKVWCLSACKKIHFIPPFFLEILQRFCKIVILSTLGLLGYGHQKQWH